MISFNDPVEILITISPQDLFTSLPVTSTQGTGVGRGWGAFYQFHPLRCLHQISVSCSLGEVLTLRGLKQNKLHAGTKPSRSSLLVSFDFSTGNPRIPETCYRLGWAFPAALKALLLISLQTSLGIRAGVILSWWIQRKVTWKPHKVGQLLRRTCIFLHRQLNVAAGKGCVLVYTNDAIASS